MDDGIAVPFRSGRIWVIAADAARARVFRTRRGETTLSQVDVLDNPLAGRGERRLRADRQGRVRDAAGGGHPLQRNATGQHLVTDDFGRRIAERLARGRRRGEVARIYLVAEPRVLGAVRASLDEPTRRLIAGTVTKDVAAQPVEEIRRRLPARL